MNRRGFLLGALAAPAVIKTPGLLMPVKKVILPPKRYVLHWPVNPNRLIPFEKEPLHFDGTGFYVRVIA